jgi:hypothetical protein
MVMAFLRMMYFSFSAPSLLSPTVDVVHIRLHVKYRQHFQLEMLTNGHTVLRVASHPMSLHLLAGAVPAAPTLPLSLRVTRMSAPSGGVEILAQDPPGPGVSFWQELSCWGSGRWNLFLAMTPGHLYQARVPRVRSVQLGRASPAVGQVPDMELCSTNHRRTSVPSHCPLRPATDFHPKRGSPGGG